MYAPCDEYDSTVPFTLVPTGWCSTNSRNGINSLTTSPAFVVRSRRPPPASNRWDTDGDEEEEAGDDSSLLGSVLLRPGGGDVGTGIGSIAAALALRLLRPLSLSRCEPRFAPPRDAPVAFRLTGPRTGRRSTNTQPTCGTGLPPIRRPSSKSHS